MRLLFPGFFDEKSIHSSEIKMETANLMDSVQGRLEDEIYKSFQYSPSMVLGTADLRLAAHQLSMNFLSRLPRLRDCCRPTRRRLIMAIRQP